MSFSVMGTQPLQGSLFSSRILHGDNTGMAKGAAAQPWLQAGRTLASSSSIKQEQGDATTVRSILKSSPCRLRRQSLCIV